MRRSLFKAGLLVLLIIISLSVTSCTKRADNMPVSSASSEWDVTMTNN